MKYQASLKMPAAEEDAAKLAEIKRQAAAIKALNHKDSATKAMLLGGPASYWLDLQGYDPVAEAVKVSRPLLVMQGEKDCQVNAATDFGKSKESLSANKNVTLKEFPKLNHLMMPVEGKSTGEEYAVAGNVAPEVVDEIARWITAH